MCKRPTLADFLGAPEIGYVRIPPQSAYNEIYIYIMYISLSSSTTCKLVPPVWCVSFKPHLSKHTCIYIYMQTTRSINVYLHTIMFRLLKSFRMPFLANIFFKWFIYDLNTISIYDFLWVQIVVMIFLWFGYVFFNGFGYDFFMIFLVLRIWFSAKNSRNFRFFLVLLEFPFPQSLFSRKFDFGSKIVKIS